MALALDAVAVARAFEVMLPKRAGSLKLLHNPNDPYDEDGEGLYWDRPSEWVKQENHDGFGAKIEFTGPVEQQKCDATNELWVLEWTNEAGEETRLAAATLPALAQWLQDNGLAFGS